MPEYRRNYQPGGTYFFTVNLQNRRQKLLTENYQLLLSSVKQVQETRPFEIKAQVVLPDHLHTIWKLPDGDHDFSTRWKMIKANFSRGLPKTVGALPRRAGERGIWQRRFWEHLIRDEKDLEKHVGYIRYNPVKHGYVKIADDWPYFVFDEEPNP